MKRGLLIVFEGIDGCGKSTQLRLLADALEKAGHPVVVTREPTDGDHGRRIRAAARSGEDVPAATQLGWFVADRREHVASVIAPALAAGHVVVSDRYTLSSVAYQGARGLDPERILADSEAEFPLPDLAIVVEVDARLGLARVEERGGVAEPGFEQLELLEAVAANFAALRCPYLARVDGARPVAVVHRDILAVVEARLGLAAEPAVAAGG